ncbi:MAG: biopolymer transporter ExbD, partial [Planctomycetes bacterium]|nr:biopolymer transporter ExbD [Planctomycetota bacterium]
MSHLAESDEEQKSDMTPMIDVVFLLIVFFLCIEFKVLESRLDAFLPTDRGSAPTRVDVQEQLVVRVHVADPGTEVRPEHARAVDGRPPRFRLVGHRVRVEVGPVACPDLDAGRRELLRLANSADSMVPDPRTGGRKRIPLVVEGYPGTRYDDIARTADLCRAA